MRVPLNVELDGAAVLCVGGGPVAAAKVVPLAAAGAVVTVVSPTCVEDLAAVAAWEARPFAAGDLRRDPPVALAVAATGVAQVDAAVAAEAAAQGTWCLRIDGRGTVTLPAVVRADGLTVALSTGAPALTSRLRGLLADRLPPTWGAAAALLAALRADPAVRAALGEVAPAVRRERWRAAVDLALAGAPSDGVRRALEQGEAGAGG